tara:strand:- start:338 stop:634 length:297 start_codon:yes stop_codon:yes gene_type:complete
MSKRDNITGKFVYVLRNRRINIKGTSSNTTPFTKIPYVIYIVCILNEANIIWYNFDVNVAVKAAVAYIHNEGTILLRLGCEEIIKVDSAKETIKNIQS